MSLLARHPSQLLGARRKRDLARGGTTAGGATRTASEDHDPFLLLLGLKPLALPEITAPPARRSLGRDESTARLDETAFRTPPPPARNIENQNPAPRRALSDPRADKPSKRGRRHRHRHRRGDDQGAAKRARDEFARAHAGRADREPKRRRVLAALGARAHHRRGKTDGEVRERIQRLGVSARAGAR
jgi:hypothetical protein